MQLIDLFAKGDFVSKLAFFLLSFLTGSSPFYCSNTAALSWTYYQNLAVILIVHHFPGVRKVDRLITSWAVAIFLSPQNQQLTLLYEAKYVLTLKSSITTLLWFNRYQTPASQRLFITKLSNKDSCFSFVGLPWLFPFLYVLCFRFCLCMVYCTADLEWLQAKIYIPVHWK